MSGCFQKDTPKAVDAEAMDSSGLSVSLPLPDVPKRSFRPTLESDKPGEASNKGASERVQNPASREEARLEAMKELKKVRGQEAAHK